MASADASSARRGMLGQNSLSIARNLRLRIFTHCVASRRRIAERNGLSMSKQIRFAIIGCGLIGQKRLNNLPRGCVTVACDTQLDRAHKLAGQTPGCVATSSVEQAVS